MLVYQIIRWLFDTIYPDLTDVKLPAVLNIWMNNDMQYHWIQLTDY